MNLPVHVPIRLCVGCGRRAPQGAMLRVTAGADGTLILATGRRHSGRSAYLHRSADCWTRFASRKGAIRSLGRSVDKLGRSALLEQLQRLDPPATQ